MTRSRLVWIAVLAIAVVAVAYVSHLPSASLAPLSPDSVQPDGTKAFVELMSALGSPVNVEFGVAPPAPLLELPQAPRSVSPSGIGAAATTGGYALVLSDSEGSTVGRLSTDQRLGIERWVISGGHLVVADPESPLTADNRVGRGSIVTVAGPGIFTNGRLGHGDNAVRVADSLGAGSGLPAYMLFPPPVSAGTKSLLSMLDLRTKVVLAGVALGILIWVLSRARRLGDPIAESRLVEVDGSVLTESMGRLMMRARAPLPFRPEDRPEDHPEYRGARTGIG